MVGNGEHLASRRREILAAAAKVFDAHGYAATTMDAVAVEAGISKGSIYNYFKSKYDLFRKVFAEAMAGGITRAEQTLAEPITATAKLKRMLDDWAEQLEHYKRTGRLMLEFWVTAAREEPDGDLASWFEQQYETWRRLVCAALTQGVEAGEFRSDLDIVATAGLIVAFVDGVTVQAILDMNRSFDPPYIASLLAAIMANLAPCGAVAPDEAKDAV